MATIEDVVRILENLPQDKLDCVHRVASALRRGVHCSVAPDSDIANDQFNDSFCNTLLTYHALHQEKLKKVTFEFAFRDACTAAGREARLAISQTEPGYDIEVDGVKYSLKTQADSQIRDNRIHLTKLMEAAGIQSFQDTRDNVRYTLEHILPHLLEADRMLVLRAFDEPEGVVRYELVEIPMSLLLRVGDVKAEDFSEPTEKKRTTHAWVCLDDIRAFSLYFDGSDEKIQIQHLRSELCWQHACWRVNREPILPT